MRHYLGQQFSSRKDYNMRFSKKAATVYILKNWGTYKSERIEASESKNFESSYYLLEIPAIRNTPYGPLTKLVWSHKAENYPKGTFTHGENYFLDRRFPSCLIACQSQLPGRQNIFCSWSGSNSQWLASSKNKSCRKFAHAIKYSHVFIICWCLMYRCSPNESSAKIYIVLT